MPIQVAARLKQLPPYLFAELDRVRREVEARGVDVINLSIGDPDLPTPSHIIEALKRAVDDPANHRYPDYQGLKRLREAVARWVERRFSVRLDSEREICALIGSKEGIANFSTAVVNPGDLVLIPDPSYPVYYSGCIFNGGKAYRLPLLAQNQFLPDLDAIPAEVARNARVLWLNYPNNPTGATVDREFLRRCVDFCLANDIILAHDIAYSEIAFDGYRAPSVLEIEDARQIAIEFHSLSKTYSMTGWRIGFAIGNAELIGALGKVKTNVDSGAFQAVQEAAITALSTGGAPSEYLEIYRQRRDLLVEALRAKGLQCFVPRATFYVWAPVPAGYTSVELAELFLRKAGVVITPGSGFGKYGEGFVRFSLTVPTERLKEAAHRMEALEF